jgi:hypothetical protein
MVGGMVYASVSVRLCAALGDKSGRQGLSDEAEDAQWPAPLDESVPIR